MAFIVTKRAADGEEQMRGLFLSMNSPHPRRWSAGPGEVFDWHAHPYDKILFVIEGTITFTDREFLNHRLDPGDRLDVPGGTDHRAVAGEDGVTCLETFL
jgi:quercetin dioxygenase-like cupin family protein